MTISSNSFTLLLLLPWAALWLAGGLWLTRAAFRLSRDEEFFIGITVGWIAQNWLANLLSWFVPTPVEFWVAAVAVFAAGATVALRNGWRSLFEISIPIPQVVIFSLMLFFHFNIGRGLAIFDDFAHLPTVSIMAAGDIPPHFSLDPQVLYAYHHFLLLFSAQLIRVGGLAPWAAIDAGRTFAFATAVMLAALFARRLTRSAIGGLFGGLMIALGSGTRWLLLLLPSGWLIRISKQIQLIGSGAGSGEDLAAAMTNFWALEGGGPVGFPFAYANGIFHAGVVTSFSANGLIAFANICLLLLTFNRWRGWLGAGLSIIFISIWGLLGEAELVGIVAGWGLVTLVYILRCKSFRLPHNLWVWLGITVSGCLIGFLEGGAWTDILIKAGERLAGGAPSSSYQTIGFTLAWPPAIVSPHLGVLSLLDPAQLLVALCELGPVLLVFPLLVVWGIKAFRLGRWYEAATAATAVVMLLMVFVQFTGSTGVRNTSRLYVFMPLLTVFAVPLGWNWCIHRAAWVKTLVAGLGAITMLGGFVMLGVAMIAAQRPTYYYSITPLDAQMYSYLITPLDEYMTRKYWNQLEPEALVFDSEPSRGTTVLGRPTNSSYTWYQVKPEWKALRQFPDPVKLRQAGYRYLYLDNHYLDELGPQAKAVLESGCARLIDEVSNSYGNFRRLVDIGACQ